MPALSPLLISILEGCLRGGATHAVASRLEVRLFRGESVLGDASLSFGQYGGLVAELRGLGGRAGEAAKVTVHSPVGPIALTVEMGSETTTLRFPRDAVEAEGEAFFTALVGQADGLGATRIQCVPEQVAFFRGNELLAVTAVGPAQLEALVVYGRIVGGIAPPERRGSAVLMSASGTRRMLAIELLDPGVVFSFG